MSLFEDAEPTAGRVGLAMKLVQSALQFVGDLADFWSHLDACSECAPVEDQHCEHGAQLLRSLTESTEEAVELYERYERLVETLPAAEEGATT